MLVRHRCLFANLLAVPALLSAAAPLPLLKERCIACHGDKSPAAGVSLSKLSADPTSFTHQFQQWEKVAAVLDEKRMPPAAAPQLADADRASLAQWVRTSLKQAAAKNAGDPGKVPVRRLTSGEYAYTIRDLIGFDLRMEGDSATDTVGGEGFTNFSGTQFMQDAGLERYLETAKRIASHAVIGAGPLRFYPDPGQSGMELSAINRIHDIYKEHGFRAASAEGGRAFGLERYSKAFYAAWRYQHRQALGLGAAVTLERLAKDEGVAPRFARHVWAFLQKPSPAFPTSEVVSRWKNLPAPPAADAAKVRAACDEIQGFLINWPRMLFAAGALAAGGAGDERALILNEESVVATASSRFRTFWFARPGDTPPTPDRKTRLYLWAVNVNPGSAEKAIVIWRKPVIRLRKRDRTTLPEQPFASLLDAKTLAKMNFGKRPDGVAIGPDEFATVAGEPLVLELAAPPDTAGGELTVEAALAEPAPGSARDAVLRITVADREDLNKLGRPPGWAILAHPDSAGFKQWKAGVLEFAGNMPQASHGEPTPADRDPIPPPYNNTYNQPERDRFHQTVKYWRTDSFLVEKMLDDSTRRELDIAWNDLMASFDYHDLLLRFVSDKYKLGLKQSIAALTPAEIEALPAEPRGYARALRTEYDAVQKQIAAAQPAHVNDALAFAERAWRRPLTPVEKDKLRGFYVNGREKLKLDHAAALRLLLTRVLVSPQFLYRVEPQSTPVAGTRPLNDWEFASRLSYFLWSSAPDAELTRAARAGELRDAKKVEAQVKRMLADARARRFATEFFGQWLGFYKFDDYRGVDATRFPEFTPAVREAMYAEAVSFFEHIVRQDRPVSEMFTANYTFLNEPLARHYGVAAKVKGDDLTLVEGVPNRGGMMRLGAVLTATSAPLRTSPVKRGDWVLRRVLGTPTPPPPADAGSIPADEKAFGGLTLKERLDQHKRNPACAACHTRIDPLGFPLERYDAVGRWRETYHDGKPVQDAAKLPTGADVQGVDGLLAYLQSRDNQVIKNFSQKLLGYALGRTILATDQPLIDRMRQDGGAVPLSKMILEIVASRQFRQRGVDRDTTPATTSTTPMMTAGGQP